MATVSAQTRQATLSGDVADEDASFLSGLAYAVWQAAESAPADAGDRDVATVALEAHERDTDARDLWDTYEVTGR